MSEIADIWYKWVAALQREQSSDQVGSLSAIGQEAAR
jgi:hypothetical protein